MTRADGSTKVLTATQYLLTTYLTYTTVSGDITVSGDYKFHTYVEWGILSPKTGENVTVHIYSSDDTLPGEYALIDVIEAVTYLSVQNQSQAEASPPTNTTASLLYNTANRRQGNFSIYYRMAQSRLSSDLSNLNISLGEDDTMLAYAYLIQYFYERKFKNWNATSVTSGGDSITKSEISGPLAAYNEVLNNNNTIKIDSTIQRHTDYENYPANWRNTQTLIDDIKIV